MGHFKAGRPLRHLFGILEIAASAQKTPDTADKLKGFGKDDFGLKGSVKEAIGKLIGDHNMEAEGKSQQKLPKSDVKPKTTPEP